MASFFSRSICSLAFWTMRSALGPGLGDEVGLHRLRVGEGALHDLLALAAGLADQLLVLGEEALRFLVCAFSAEPTASWMLFSRSSIMARRASSRACVSTKAKIANSDHRPERELELQVE